MKTPYNKNYMSIGVSVRATKFVPDNYREPQLGQLARGYGWEGWRKAYKKQNVET